MIRKFVQEDAINWDRWLEPLLFAEREVAQASTGFSPFELLYGRQPRGVLDIIRETLEERTYSIKKRNSVCDGPENKTLHFGAALYG